jgi:hypothetical protein
VLPSGPLTLVLCGSDKETREWREDDTANRVVPFTARFKATDLTDPERDDSGPVP